MRGQCNQRGAMKIKQQFVCIYLTFLVHFNVKKKGKFFKSLKREELWDYLLYSIFLGPKLGVNIFFYLIKSVILFQDIWNKTFWSYDFHFYLFNWAEENLPLKPIYKLIISPKPDVPMWLAVRKGQWKVNNWLKKTIVYKS